MRNVLRADVLIVLIIGLVGVASMVLAQQPQFPAPTPITVREIADQCGKELTTRLATEISNTIVLQVEVAQLRNQNQQLQARIKEFEGKKGSN